MKIRIKQGDACILPVRVLMNGAPVDIDDVDTVEFRAGDVRKLYPQDAAYDRESGCFHVPLRQEDTFSLPEDDAVIFDVRVKFKGGSVIGTQKITALLTVDALSEEVI